MSNLFQRDLQVVNIGLESFKETLDAHHVKANQLDWKPPLSVSPEAMQAVASARARITRANDEAVERVVNGGQC